MKKIFSIILIFVIIFLHITVYAEYKLRYEELPQTESILAPDIEMNEKNWIFSVIKEEEPFRRIIQVRDNKYIISINRYNAQSQPLPVKIGLNHESSADCIWTGEYYYLRGTYLDGYWPDANQYALPLTLYDENGNKIKTYELNKRANKNGFGQHVIKIGYLNGIYYALLRAEGQDREEKVIKSIDFENWEITNEEVPQIVGNIMMKENDISARGYDFIGINYEETKKYTLFYTLGDWIVDKDEEGDFYISNDNIYFVKLNSPKELKQSDEQIDYVVNCVYEYNDNIIIDLFKKTYDNGAPAQTTSIIRLTVQKDEIYDRLDEMKNSPYVVLNNKILGFDVPPIIEDGSTLVPMRFLFEQMGADVEWDSETQTATATLDNKAVTFSIDNVNARINNKSAKMDVPARLVNGKTMVPLRFLSENMGYDVDWDADSRTAIVR